MKIIPVSATVGDNLNTLSPQTPWYTESPLLDYLENVEVAAAQGHADTFVMPVQRTSRPDHTFRGFQGEIVSGAVRLGDGITVLPSGEKAHVSRIIAAGAEKEEAEAGQPVTLCLDKEVDVSRGCVLASPENSLHICSSMAVTLLWMDETELKEGNSYRVQIGTFATFGTVRKIRHLIDINTGKPVRNTVVRKNDLALCELQLGMPAVTDSFSSTPALGELILIDRISHATSACGIVEYPLGEEGDIYAQEVSVNREMREKRFGCRAQTVWMTGLSGAGKSTLADQIEKVLFASGIPTMLLDGDNVRSGLCAGLGFSAEGRRENIRRVAEAAKLLNDAGVTVIAAFVSPFREDREMARRIIGSAFMEVYVNASL